ncbi:TonB-dependent receptor [Aquimarina sp. ERC-38]|uniref:TonB-dependent receptor n=1 Tax=Aquimarina sp. ERC-38 TaxID=2949996 RepID=UPI002247863B|nr:TonB-dependent receptor [Aquimarina sp. ERC-38]UZO79231.1 TonB-dependent receptor [Aquimarina sp. ERC-38]
MTFGKNKRKHILSIVFYFIFSFVFSQAKIKKKSLSAILVEVSNTSPYTFSYLDRDIRDVEIPIPLPDQKEILVLLEYFQKHCNLEFKVLPNNIIAVYLQDAKSIVKCGIVTNINGNPIEAVVNGNDFRKTTDGRGEFNFVATEEKETIVISAPGYITKRFLAKQFTSNTCKPIILQTVSLDLEEVVVTNYLIKGIFKNSDGSISLDYSDFGILPGLTEPDLLQTLQSLPGITSANETISDLNIRGGTRDQNLILWDGIKMYQFSHFFGLISTFNPYLTSNVRVYKNGTDASYGDGVSSVIEMNTSNEVQHTFTASAGLNLISTDIYVDTPISKNSSVQIAFRRSINDFVETPTYTQFFDKAFQDTEVVDMNNSDIDFSFRDASIRGLFKIGKKDMLKVNGILMGNNLLFQENSMEDNNNTSKQSSISQNNYALGLSHIRDWTPDWKSEIFIYGSSYLLESNNSDVINNQTLIQRNDVLETGVKSILNRTVSNKINAKIGYQFNETGIANLRRIDNPGFIASEKDVLRTHSGFTEVSFNSLNKKTMLNAGLRINYITKLDKTYVEPRISYQQKLNKHFTFELLGELKSQTTTQIIDFQNDFLGVENRRWVLADDTSDNPLEIIPVVTSQQISSGLQYQNRSFLIQTDFYYKNVNGILARSQGFLNQYEFANDTGAYNVKGMDFLVTKKIKDFNTWIGYSYAQNDYEFTTLEDSNFKNNIDIRHQINIAAAYSTRKLAVSAGLTWRTGIPSTLPRFDTDTSITDSITYEFPNSDRLEDYVRMDISATYKFRWSDKLRSMVGLSVWNTFSRNNITNRYYRLSSDNQITEIEEEGLGFTPNLVFRIIF